MAATPKLKKALEQLEARRIELERQIVADLDRKFFNGDERPVRSVTSYRLGTAGYDGLLETPPTTTAGATQYTMTWFATT